MRSGAGRGDGGCTASWILCIRAVGRGETDSLLHVEGSWLCCACGADYGIGLVMEVLVELKLELPSFMKDRDSSLPSFQTRLSLAPPISRLAGPHFDTVQRSHRQHVRR